MTKPERQLLIIGFGYSARAILNEVRPRFGRVVVTVRGAEKAERLRAEGIEALVFDGESRSDALSAACLEATDLVISAPPSEMGDPALNQLGTLFTGSRCLRRLYYLSTVGVYGDHNGAWVDEGTRPKPTSPRSRQRLQAEAGWQALAQQAGCELGIFRLSGIYGPGRSAIDNLRAGTARRIHKPGQVFNRIHIEDIAGALASAMEPDRSLGILNLTDDEPAPPQDVVAYGARLLGMPIPPEIPFEAAALSEMGRSFYSENKRVSNARIKAQLGYAFRCPSYREGLLRCLEPKPVQAA